MCDLCVVWCVGRLVNKTSESLACESACGGRVCVSREASDSFPVGKECLSLCVVCEGRQGPQEGVPLAVVVGGGCFINDPLHHLIWYFFNYTIPYIIYYTI